MLRNLALIIGLAGLTLPLSGASLLITPANQYVTVAAGDLVTFSATFTRGDDSDVYLNGSAINVDGLSFSYQDLFGATLDIFPYSVNDSNEANVLDLVKVAVSDPLLDDPGDHELTYALFGGADMYAQDYLGTAHFFLTIPDSTGGGGDTGGPGGTPGGSPGDAPEPSTWALAAGAAPALLLLRRGTRRRLPGSGMS